MFLFFRKYVRRFHEYYIFLIILFLLPVLIIMNESQALVAVDDRIHWKHTKQFERLGQSRNTQLGLQPFHR